MEKKTLTMPTTSPAYPASTLAKLFHLTERRVQQLAKEGILVKSAQGKYDLVASVQGYVKYLQDRAMGRSDGSYADPSDIKLERKRLIKAQADNAECEYQVRRGELVSLDLVKHLLNEVAVLYGSSLDALPGRLAQELAGIPDPALIKNKLFDECRHIRNLTAGHLERFAETERADQTIYADCQSTFAKNTC
jgi:phage terminase Nu1 subunit (DNA packaging protein)